MTTRRRRISNLIRVALLLGALIASACGSAESEGSTPLAEETPSTDDATATGETEEPAGADEEATAESLAAETATERDRGGVLRIGLEAESDSLDPTHAALAPAGRVMAQAIFSTLVSYDENDNWVPNLSESWTASDDRLTWDLRLREGVAFTDGTPLNADAVITTWEAQLANQLLGLAIRPIFDPTRPFEKVDDLTVRLYASAPEANMPTYFTGQLGMIASPAWLEAAASDPELRQQPVGAGPYILDSRQQDVVTVLRSNPDWIGADVFADDVEIYPLPREGARVSQLAVGDLDVIHATSAEGILELREDDGVTRVEDDSGQETMLVMNGALPPFDDLRVREAATLAFPEGDYDEFIRRGASTRADSLWPPSSKWHDPSITQATDDPDGARVLIDSYCGDLPEQCTDGKVDVTFLACCPNVM